MCVYCSGYPSTVWRRGLMIGVGGQGAEGRGFLFTPGLYAGSLGAGVGVPAASDHHQSVSVYQPQTGGTITSLYHSISLRRGEPSPVCISLRRGEASHHHPVSSLGITALCLYQCVHISQGAVSWVPPPPHTIHVSLPHSES